MGLDIYFTKQKNIGYFRKVNFLVNYFENLGLDVENQTPFYIYKENIIELINRCKQVLKNHTLAEVLLPTMEGFFFGSTDYNESYFNDVKEVLKYCEEILIPEFDTLTDDECILFYIWY